VRVDAHQHYWDPARGDYGWMPKDDPVLARRWGPDDLAPQLATQGIDATVLVQAAPTVAETEYLLGIADATASVAGVVGWVDFEAPGDLGTLRRLADHPKFLGVRPMIQDIADDRWMLRDEVQWAFRAVCDLDLTFDALGFPRHLPHFDTLVARYSDMRVVVDHCMKPDIARHDDAALAKWAEGMSRLAARGARCKLSGLVTEAAADWSVGDLAPYAAHVLAAFGPDRVMWGSDWPVCLLRADYSGWYTAAGTLCADLSPGDRDRVFGGTAAEFYRLGVTGDHHEERDTK
jgi:L-fuconolactonase